MRTKVNVLAVLVVAAVAPAGLAAQVGHAPESSPYRDLRAKQAASVVGGYLTGSRGKVGLGPSDGPIFGIRYDRVIGTPVDIRLGLSYARLTRYQVDPTRPLASRTTGPIKQDLVIMETGASLLLMGRKTWRGLSPYIGGILGVAFETGLSDDLTGYQYGTKAFVAPHAGIKWFPVQAFAIKVEAHDYIWRLSYPEQFAIPYSTTIPAVLPDAKLNEWTHHPTLLVSVGYTFTF